jgi:Flp pilus assembly protein CpaB
LLVVGGALAFADASLHLGSRQNVLVTTRALTAGEVLDTSDLTTAAISTNSGLQFVAANEESIVVGRPLAVPLVAGVPITTGEVGSPSSVVAGSDVVAVLLKPGGFPPSLSPGDRVEVVPVAPSGLVAPSTNPLPATVLSVSADPSDADGSSVIGLQVQSSVAATVAQLATTGEASLIQLGPSS